MDFGETLGAHFSGWAAPVDVLDRRLMAPGNLVARDAEDRGNLVALRRARGPAAQDDGQDALLVQSRAFRQLLVVDPLFLAQLLHALGGLHHRYLSDRGKTK